MRTILLLNAPPSSGKDTMAELVQQFPLNYQHFKFSAPLKAACAALFGLSREQVSIFEADKQRQRKELCDRTWRQVQINLAEQHARHLYGRDFFSQVVVQQVQNCANVVISDCGFEHELEAFTTENFAVDRMVVVHIFRPGCNYADDSRTWVGRDLPHWPTSDKLRLEAGERVQFALNNNGSLTHLRTQVSNMLEVLHG